MRGMRAKLAAAALGFTAAALAADPPATNLGPSNVPLPEIPIPVRPPEYLPKGDFATEKPKKAEPQPPAKPKVEFQPVPKAAQPPVPATPKVDPPAKPKVDPPAKPKVDPPAKPKSEPPVKANPEAAPAPSPVAPAPLAVAPAPASAPTTTVVSETYANPIDPRYSVYRSFGRGVGYGSTPSHYDSGYTSLEAFAPVWQDPGSSLAFVNGRAINFDGGQLWEAQIGGGYRTIAGSTVLGINGFYDGRNTDAHFYHQLGFGFEALRECWEFRSNFYFPIGQQRYVAGDNGFSNPAFFRTNILLDHSRVIETALRGFDVEAGRALPRLSDNTRTYAYLGYYHYDNTGVAPMNGIRGRLESWIGERASVNLAVQYDEVTHTTMTGGLALHFGGVPKGSRAIDPLGAKLGNRVVRDPNINIQRTNQTTKEFAIDPATGKPIEVRHVASYATAGGDGTVEHPFQTLGQLQAGSRSNMILFAHSGSVFNNQNIVLQPNQRFLGEGIDHLFTATQGTFLLPRATFNNGLPQIVGAPGNAITLADRNEVSGFVVTGAAGTGIMGNGLTAFDINRNIITGSGANGINLMGVNGTGRIVGNISSGNAFGVLAGGSGIAVAGTAFTGDIVNNTAANNAAGDLATGNGINVAVTTVTANIVGNTTTGNATGVLSTGNGISVAATTFNGTIARNTASGNANNTAGTGNGINVAVGTLNGSVTGNTANDNASGVVGTGNGITIAATTLNGNVSGNTASNNANNVGGTGNGINVAVGTLNGNVTGNTTNGNANGTLGTGSGINVGATTIAGAVSNNTANGNAAGTGSTGNGITVGATTFNGAVSGNTANGNANNLGAVGQGIAVSVGGVGRSILDVNNNSVSGNTAANNPQLTITQGGAGILGVNFAGNSTTTLLAAPFAFDFRNTGAGIFQVNVGTNTGTTGSSFGAVIFAPPGTAFP